MTKKTTDELQLPSKARRRVLKQLTLLAASLSFFKAELLYAANQLIHGVRLWRSPDKTRLVFDVSGAVDHHQFQLTNPRRLVIDVSQASWKASQDDLVFNNTPITKIRHGIRNKNDLRIVLELNEAVTSKSFLLKPYAAYGHRLVVDVFNDQAVKPQPTPVKSASALRDVVIAVDAGHGGEDPGALAYGGGYEKTVTLAIAKMLAALINKERGFKAVLVRTGDYYVDLKKRTRIARDNNADLLISIHADGFTDRRAKGASVYAVSRRGATSETARWLAEKENSADLIGGEDGISLSDKDDVVAGVLLDLSMESTLRSSIEVGNEVLSNMGKINSLHKKQVEQAGFVVLKSADIPSILVETGFITNPEESRKLKTRSHQQAMAKAIFNGMKTWFHQKPPTNTYLAKWKQEGTLSTRPSHYKVRSGDTLSEIAQHFDLSLNELRSANKLSNASKIRVGQTLVIPKS